MISERNLFTYVFCVFSLLAILSSQASAIDALESQENIVVTVERGTTQEFPLVIQNVDTQSTVKSRGEIAGWIGFWEEGQSEAEIYPGQGYVLLKIKVPEGTDLGEYEGEILSEGATISKVKVKVTLELSDVKAYEKLSDVDREVGTLKEKVNTLTEDIGTLRSQVATLEYDISQKMDEIYQYQKDLNDLETENNKLTMELSELKNRFTQTQASNEELNQITGMLVGTQLPGMFLGGLVLGAVVVAAILRREVLKEKLKQKVKSTAPGRKGKDDFKYSFTGK